jgi:hypothetical protein
MAAETFCFTWIDAHTRPGPPARSRLRESIADPQRADGVTMWGAFAGLFGVAASDVLLMTQGGGADARPRRLPPECTVREQISLEPTVRPKAPALPLTRPGLYVFRFFETEPRHVEEFVRLSNEAWTSFEHTADYRAEPQGLFRALPGDADPESRARLLLVTWYDGFASWERSRRPAPEAAANFQRRQTLTQTTIAYATRLIEGT